MSKKLSYVFAHKTPLPFPVVAAFLRLGSKYEIEQPKTEAMARLTYEYPPCLGSFQGRIDNHGGFWTIFRCSSACTRDKHPSHAAYCILHLLSILFFRRNFQGCSKGGYQFSLQGQQTCILGHQQLFQKQVKRTYLWLTSTSYQQCRTLSDEEARAINSSTAASAGIQCSVWEESWGIDMCESCIDSERIAHKWTSQSLG